MAVPVDGEDPKLIDLPTRPRPPLVNHPKAGKHMTRAKSSSKPQPIRFPFTPSAAPAPSQKPTHHSSRRPDSVSTHPSPSSMMLKPPTTAPGPISITSQPNNNPKPLPLNNNDSGGLSSGKIAAAVVVPIIVVLLGIGAIFFVLRRRRRDKGTAATQGAGSGQGAINGSSTSMVQQVQYSKTSSLERRGNDAPPPPYASYNEKPPTPPRLDSSSLLHPPKASTGNTNGADTTQPPSPSFAETVFMTNPSLLANGSDATATENTQSSDAKGDMPSSYWTTNTTSPRGREAGRVREDDEVSAISGDEEGLYDGDTEVEYAEAGTAKRHRASVIDMNIISSSPPKE